jgi:hypothetical protein
LIFVVRDLNRFIRARGKFVADVDEIRPQYQDSNLSDGSAVFNSSLVRSVGPSIGATIDQLDALTLTEVGSLNELATPWYADQVLPFDITLAGANEYGAMTAADQGISSFRQQPSSRTRAPRHGHSGDQLLLRKLSSGGRKGAHRSFRVLPVEIGTQQPGT